MEQIPIHLLNAFVVFNQSSSITEAARRLQITQPALSKQLKQLESFLPQAVFTTSGRKKVLTSYGEDLHRRLQEKLGNIQEVIQQTGTLHASPQQAVVRIAGRRGVLDRFSSQLSFEGSLYFEEKSNESTLEAILSRTIDVGIVHKVPDHFEIIAKPLFREEFQIVIPKSFVTKRPTFGANLYSQLQPLPCLAYRPDDELIQAAFALNPRDMKSLQMRRATENYLSLAEMVEAELGWALLPTYLPVSEKKNWVVPIPPRILPSRQFFLIFRKEFASVPWFKALMIDIRKCFDSEKE
jgi:DNA-binding transcriptional LysR family regulator